MGQYKKELKILLTYVLFISCYIDRYGAAAASNPVAAAAASAAGANPHALHSLSAAAAHGHHAASAANSHAAAAAAALSQYGKFYNILIYTKIIFIVKIKLLAIFRIYIYNNFIFLPYIRFGHWTTWT